ncbi:MAG: cytochrome bc complex cytochrome b subunit [Nitrospirota bacterium]|nr:MAG: cytochrome bc complex cytochrome b subunit [Nitrospirota bacterium]
MFDKIKDWIDKRTGLRDIVDSKLRTFKVPDDSGFMSTLGAVALAAFIVQVITGIFLMMYYVPHPDHAFGSIRTINNEVPFGWLFRSIHVVGSNIIIVVAFIHLLRVLARISYKRPREMTWMSGSLMFFIILFFCISGYLLSWNQLSYWSTTIITNMPTFFPLLGDMFANFLRGDEFVSGATITRFFSFHVAFLPFIFVLLVGLHLLLVWRTGLAGSKSGGDASVSGSLREVHDNGIPLFPDYFTKELFMSFVYISVIFFIISFFPLMFHPPAAGVEANPLAMPDEIRPPWYFIAPYVLIRIIPNKFIGISMLLLISAVFLLWPFIDMKEERDLGKRPYLRASIIAGVVIWLALTLGWRLL